MKRNAALLAAFVLLLSIVAGSRSGRADTPAEVGQWLGPFSEDLFSADGQPVADGVGDFNAAPPSSADESARFPAAVSSVVLPDGDHVLYWNGIEGSEQADISIGLQSPVGATSRTRVLDLSSYFATGEAPTAASVTTPDPDDGGGGDLFCADQRHLADGRVIAVGGNEWQNEDSALGLPKGLGRNELYGIANTRVYNPLTNKWTQAGDMNHRRWYPTLLTLPNGNLFVAGGVSRLVYNSKAAPGHHDVDATDVVPRNVRESEIFDPATGQWTKNTGDGSKASLPLFARLHLMPNGKIFYDGSGQMFSPAGGDVDELGWDMQKLFNPATNAWEDAGRAQFGSRGGVFSVMLPIDAPYTEGRLLIGGGPLGPTPGGYIGTGITEIATVHADGSVMRERKADMNNARWYSSGVVLPTGEVVAFSGADRDEVVTPGFERPVHTPELYDPVADTWTALAETHADGSPVRDRTYHNTAILLKDGSILVGGHSPVSRGYGSHGSNPPPFANNFKDPSFEIFRPPYLFRGARPTLQTVPDTILRGPTTFAITSPDATDPTIKAVLVRLPAMTHLTDADQRTVVLEKVSAQGSSIVLRPPPSASVLPPGPYYLFLLKTNAEETKPTPSVAQVVTVLP